MSSGLSYHSGPRKCKLQRWGQVAWNGGGDREPEVILSGQKAVVVGESLAPQTAGPISQNPLRAQPLFPTAEGALASPPLRTAAVKGATQAVGPREERSLKAAGGKLGFTPIIILMT